MHKLQRGETPDCLTKFQHGRNNWNDVSPEDKQEIWNALDSMQGTRCAYCETAIHDGSRHIEHFRQKGRDPKGTFLWSNLFGSCNREDSCGKNKDRCGQYTPADLIKPDEDNPEKYLIFSPDGSVAPRHGLSPEDHRRASETIRILNLNGVLRQIRHSELVGYMQTVDEFSEIAKHYPREEWLPLLEEEIATISRLPFATAIRHVLTRQK